MSALEEKIGEIEQKRRDHERNEELEQAVERADERIGRYNNRMESLESTLAKLVHRNTIVTDVFGRSEVPKVDTARMRVQSVVETTQDDVLAAVDGGDLSDETETVKNVERVADKAVDESKSRLSDVQSKWTSKVSTAESIIRITDGGSQEIQLTEDVEDFVKREAWKLSRDPVRLSNEWSGLEAKWENLGITWDEFQREHGLSDAAIELLERLADDRDVTLSTTNADVVAELFAVESLRENLELTI